MGKKASMAAIKRLKEIYQGKIEREATKKIKEVDNKREEIRNKYHKEKEEVLKTHIKQNIDEIGFFFVFGINHDVGICVPNNVRNEIWNLTIECDKEIEDKCDKDWIRERKKQLVNELVDWEERQIKNMVIGEGIEEFEVNF